MIYSRVLGVTSQAEWSRLAILGPGQTSHTHAAFCRMLWMYYLSNGLYDALMQSAYENAIWTPGMKALRNPAHRAVEFYPAKLWPGDLPRALPIVAENERIIPAIEQVWAWSGWASAKQVFARWFALFGDGFIKVATRKDGAGVVRSVYLQNIHPQCVTDLDSDERGYLTYVRIDVPQERRDAQGDSKAYTRTEVWDKAAGSYRVYEHKRPEGARVAELGSPVESAEIKQLTGSDFIPIAQARFQDIGESRGLGCFVAQLDKIDEANRMATRLHQILFRYNKPTMVVSANANDATNRPLPPPMINTGRKLDGENALGDDDILRMPGMSTAQYMVPQLNYQAHLAIVQDHMLELERDLPELAYYRLRDMSGGDLSGRAVRLLLSDLIDRAREVRGNAESTLARAHQMALTIGVNTGLFPASIGSYERGDFEHAFAEREIITPSESERFETVQLGVNSGVPLTTMLRRVGWDEAEIVAMQADADAERKRAADLAPMLLDAARMRFDQGDSDSDQDGEQ